MKLAIISDIHSNNEALKKALCLIKGSGVDHVIFLGDLLTYGCSINESIDTLLDFSATHNMSFIKGNHDQIYFDIQSEKEFQYKPFPDFIIESVAYTHRNLDRILIQTFNWQNFITFEEILFSHANALEYGNWSYLNSEDEIENTAKLLLKSGLLGGVFGHTHRNKYSIYEKQKLEIKIDESLNYQLRPHKCFIANTGSIGQPRGRASSYLLMSIENQSLNMKHIYFEYNLDKHKRSIRRSSLTDKTKDTLLSYFN